MITFYKVTHYRHQYKGRLEITHEKTVATLYSIDDVLLYIAQHAPDEDLDEARSDLETMGVAWFGHYTVSEYTRREA